MQPADKTTAESFARQAILHHRRNELRDAVVLYRKALASFPGFVEAEVNLASALQAMGALTEAVQHLRHVIALRPGFAVAHYNLGNALAALGSDPCAAYRAAIAADPDYSEAWYNLGIALEAAGQSEEAENAYRNAVAIQPAFAAAHMNLGVLLYTQGRYDEALLICDAALAAAPTLAAAHNNRGNVLRAQGAADAAADAYRAAIACDPQLAEAHNHLGNLLRDGNRLTDAAACYRKAAETAPHFAEPFYNLGYVLIELGKIEEGCEVLTRYARLTCVAQPVAERPPHKLAHDAQQRAYLGPYAPDPAGPLRLEGGGRVAGTAVKPHPEVESRWTGRHPTVVIDDLLTPDALAGLRAFCNGSTIWREVYDVGYLGAFPEHGVACPLLAQIAQELRSAYPGIFRDHPLLQLWAFKYGSRIQGIPLHADFAAVNVNFWITPDDANLDPAHGGLVIWDKPAPLDWDFSKYNMDAQAGHDFLRNNGAKATTIPYRCNRAVIFDSDLFHETDTIAFAEGYTNRRINITLLYGRR